MLQGTVVTLPAESDAPASEGAPLAGCTVDAWMLSKPKQRGSVTTAADGSFRIEWPDPGTRPLGFSLLTAKDARPFYRRGWKGELGAGETTLSVLVLARLGHTSLHGRAIDPAGQPLVGVEVTLEGRADGLHARTDEAGRFAFEAVAEARRITAALPGYLLQKRSMPEFEAERFGRFAEALLVLSPEAGLTVLVQNPDGTPRSSAGVRVLVSPTERFGQGTARGADDNMSLFRRTGEDGRARLRVWAGQRLAVRFGKRDFEGVQGFRLVESSAAPLVLTPGEEREVVIAPPPEFFVVGRVVDADGKPQANGTVELIPLEDGRPSYVQLTGREGRAEGEFRIAVPTTEAHGRALVCAGSRGSWNPADYHAYGRSEVLLAGRAAGDVVEVNVVRQPRTAIEGRVTIGGRTVPEDLRLILQVSAYPVDSSLPPGRDPRGRSTTVSFEGERFRCEGFQPGVYDLWIASYFAGEVWLRGVAAGERDLWVDLPGEHGATVELSIELPKAIEEVPGRPLVLSGRLDPFLHAGPPHSLPELRAQLDLHDPVGWPLELYRGRLSGARRVDTPFGSVPLGTSIVSSFPHELKLEPGWHWMGVWFTGRKAEVSAPQGTGLIYVGPGKHRLGFHPRRLLPVEGRVVGLAQPERWTVALTLADGAAVPLRTARERWLESVEVGATGHFGFQAPEGEFLLRLEAGLGSPAGRHVERVRIEPAMEGIVLTPRR